MHNILQITNPLFYVPKKYSQSEYFFPLRYTAKMCVNLCCVLKILNYAIICENGIEIQDYTRCVIGKNYKQNAIMPSHHVSIYMHTWFLIVVEFCSKV